MDLPRSFAGWKPRLRRLRASFPGVLAARFAETDLLTHAASLSFFALLSLAPLLVLVLWLSASLYPDAQQALLAQIGQVAGGSAEVVARTVLRNADAQPDVGSIAGLWSTLLLFVGATTVFARLQATLNAIFRCDAARLGPWAWVRKRIFSFGVVLALGFLVIVSTLLGTAIELVFSHLPAILPVVADFLSLAVYALSFALLYHYLPDRHVRWRQALSGGAITAALFFAGRWGIQLYLQRAAPGSAYGSMGTLVVLLVWMYYAAMIFFAGALITAVVDERAAGDGGAGAPAPTGPRA